MKNFLFFAMVLLLASCSSSTSEFNITHYPFVESENDYWGLVDVNGKTVIKDEYKNTPSIVMNDIFYVENDGTYEMYSVKKPKVLIEEKFKNIGFFTEEYAPSVKKGEGIKYVDKRGKIVYELPLEYTTATVFVNGYSRISTSEDEVSYIDKKFNIISSKEFTLLYPLGKNRFLATKEDKDQKYVTYIIDENDKVLHEYKQQIVGISNDGKYFRYYDDGAYGLMSKDGDIILRAKYEKLSFAYTKNYLYFNENGLFGIINTKGEIVLKPKYKGISHKDGLLVAMREEGVGLLDQDDEKVLKFDNKLLTFLPGSTNVLSIKTDSESWKDVSTIFDKKGKTLFECSSIEGYQDFVQYIDIYFNWRGHWIVESDYYNVDKLVKAILEPSPELSIDQIFGSIGQDPGQCVNRIGLDLKVEDIRERNRLEYFPYVSCEFNFGKYEYSLGFTKVTEEYTDYSYGYGVTRYRYAADGVCVGCDIHVELDSKSKAHIDVIKERFEDCLKMNGYRNKEESDYSTYYNNGKKKISVNIYDQDIYLTVLPYSE